MPPGASGGLLLLAGCGGSVATVAGASGASRDAGGLLAEGGEGKVLPPSEGASPCLAEIDQTAALKVSMTVSWAANHMFVGGSGPYELWLLARYAIDGQNNITSAMSVCQIVTPSVMLGDGPDLATSVPPTTFDDRLASPATEWARVTRTASARGVQGDRSIGSSIAIDPFVFLFGLGDSSAYETPATPWPPASSDPYPFGTTPDYEDEEGDGTPGITLLSMASVPPTPGGYGPIATSLSSRPRIADRIFAVARIGLSLYGTYTSCVEARGTADVSLIDRRFVGCSIEGDGGLCSPDEAAFVDATWVTFLPGSATFDQVELSPSATCDDVVAAIPDGD